MKISMIAAMGNHNVIGFNNQLPWHLPADLQYFKQCTLHKPIIMGRSTFESIGRILPGRQNIVVTRNLNYKINAPVPENASLTIVHSLEEAIANLRVNTTEAMIIGGSTLFNEALPKTDRLYLTLIHHDFKGDTFFPKIDQNQWQEMWREDHKADEKNQYDYSFVVLEK
jgi:dihydrofolate reductase